MSFGFMAEKKESYIDRYGRRARNEVEIDSEKTLILQQAGIFARRVDIYLNDVKLKSMGFTLPMSSFKTEIDGKLIEIRQRTKVVGGWKKAMFIVSIDGENVKEFYLSKQGSHP